jgi:hypothetical protein
MQTIKPYANEEESLAIDELTIENREDRISLYGSVQLTRDRQGLERARQLKALLDAVVTALESDADLPERISIRPAEQVKNPFD